MEHKLKGNWNNRRVWLDDMELLPKYSQQVYNHSPDGFNWGYDGSGPAQLALAICLELMPKQEAKDWYQSFKMNVISKLPVSSFEVKFYLKGGISDEIKLEKETEPTSPIKPNKEKSGYVASPSRIMCGRCEVQMTDKKGPELQEGSNYVRLIKECPKCGYKIFINVDSMEFVEGALEMLLKHKIKP